jgi:ribosome-associated heat shock protein Hsp15
LIEKRVSAAIAKEHYEDLTSVEELQKLEIKDNFFINRDRGAGRPTKKERRMLEKLRKGEL